MLFPLLMPESGNLMCRTQFRNAFIVQPDGNLVKCDIDDSVTNKPGFIDSNGELQLDKEKPAYWLVPEKKPDHCDEGKLLPLCFGLKCSHMAIYRNQKCGLYNNLSIIRNAMKAYALDRKYPYVE